MPRFSIKHFATAALLLIPTLGRAQTLTDAEQTSVEQWMQAYDTVNSSLLVTIKIDDKDKVIEQQQTLLSFLNPEFSGRHGRFYLWTEQGRPVMTSSILSQVEGSPKQYRTVIYEFHSLVQGGIQVARDEQVIWHCQQPGVKWLDGPSGVVPAANASRRLTQMRDIARRYNATGAKREFRLLSQPIYRYPADTPDVTDGAIFSYGLTTDPCVLLMVEARGDQWKIAFVRSNQNLLRVQEGSIEVWSRERTSDLRLDPTQPFFLYWGAEHRHVDDPSIILSTPWKRQ